MSAGKKRAAGSAKGENKDAYAVLIAGVAGSGKSTIAPLVAKRLNCCFFDGNNLHTETNIEKMRSGIPLDDSDRYPWLERIKCHILNSLTNGVSIVVECSAIKPAYRNFLRENVQNICIIVLLIEREVVTQRITLRRNSFFSPSLVESQFNDFSITDKDICIRSDAPLDSLVDQIELNVKKHLCTNNII